jgi:hypothetical protein
MQNKLYVQDEDHTSSSHPGLSRRARAIMPDMPVHVSLCMWHCCSYHRRPKVSRRPDHLCLGPDQRATLQLLPQEAAADLRVGRAGGLLQPQVRRQDHGARLFWTPLGLPVYGPSLGRLTWVHVSTGVRCCAFSPQAASTAAVHLSPCMSMQPLLPDFAHACTRAHSRSACMVRGPEHSWRVPATTGVDACWMDLSMPVLAPAKTGVDARDGGVPEGAAPYPCMSDGSEHAYFGSGHRSGRTRWRRT